MQATPSPCHAMSLTAVLAGGVYMPPVEQAFSELDRGARGIERKEGASEREMATRQQKKELDEKAEQGETVVPGGTGGKSVEAQERLAEGRSRGGQTRREQLGSEGYQELGSRGGQTRKEQMGKEGYQEMGRKGGLSTMEQSGGERAAELGVEIDESKFTK